MTATEPYRVVVDVRHWSKPTWSMRFGALVRYARSAGLLAEGYDEDWDLYWMQAAEGPWLIEMGPKKNPIRIDQRKEWDLLWMIGGIHGWLNEAIEVLVKDELAKVKP